MGTYFPPAFLYFPLDYRGDVNSRYGLVIFVLIHKKGGGLFSSNPYIKCI